MLMEDDGTISRVFCPSCDNAVDAPDAAVMYETLRKCYVVQQGRNIVRRELRGRGMGNLPVTGVDNEFSDPRWPFIMMLQDENLDE